MSGKISKIIVVGAVVVAVLTSAGLAAAVVTNGGSTEGTPIANAETTTNATPTTTTPTATWSARDESIGNQLLRINDGQFGTMCSTADRLPGGEDQFHQIAEKFLGGLIVKYGGDVTGTVDYMISRC